MKLLTWNLAGRTSKVAEQVKFIARQEPHILALQEVTQATWSLLVDALSAEFAHIVTSFDLAPDHSVLVGPRRYGEIIASTYPLTPLPPAQFDIPWPERVLSCRVGNKGRFFEMHTTHMPPGSSNGWIKIETFEGIYRRLACPSAVPRILCGDFNSPKEEWSDGMVVCFGERVLPDGTIRVENSRGHPPGRWAAGERSVLRGLAEFDLPDVFRLLNGYRIVEASWHLPRDKSIGRRFDHIFASRQLNPVDCRYLHDCRKDGLSDHSAMLATFEF